MENRQEYLGRLKLAVERLHHCVARHCISVAIHEQVAGQTVWKGAVEVFDITGNPKSSVCYAWSHSGGKYGVTERVIAMLGIPPVISPLEAVRASLAADGKQ